MISIKSESLDILVRSVEKEKPFNYYRTEFRTNFRRTETPA